MCNHQKGGCLFRSGSAQQEHSPVLQDDVCRLELYLFIIFTSLGSAGACGEAQPRWENAQTVTV